MRKEWCSCEMDDLKQLTQIDWWYVCIALLLLLVCIKLVWSLFDWLLFEKLGVETRKMKQRREQRELLKTTAELAKTTAENLAELQMRHTRDEEEFRNNLNNYMKESREDRRALHDEVTKLVDNRNRDREQNIKVQKELDEKIINLTDMFIDKEIDDMRYKILDFASSISSGKNFNRESYDHILRIYDKYERILEEHNMENGLVEESIKYIQSSYQDFLKSGMTNY